MNDSIAAIATPPGHGGIGIVRISGSLVPTVCQALLGKMPAPRTAEYHRFLSVDKTTLDEGLALYFPSPNSFTGEDVLELQGHGGPVVLDSLLKEVVDLGVRLARPGEFSERAFLNGKLDLSQAEAIADLIAASSEQAARSAIRSLQGQFSALIRALVDELIHLRCYVEAAIDFPDEEIDFLSAPHIEKNLNALIGKIKQVLLSAQQGVLLKEGAHLVIAGPPNAGKSSLLNYFSGEQRAIVTNVPGTTRDILKEHIHLDGIPLHVIDTAGLRETVDVVEQEGIRRTREAVKKADLIVLVFDDSSKDPAEINALLKEFMPLTIPITLVFNKIDLSHKTPTVLEEEGVSKIFLSLKENKGLDLLKTHLKKLLLSETSTLEGAFLARRRHIDALQKALAAIETGYAQLQQHHAGELLAEDLKHAQQALSSITGEFHSDDLLGEIFSSFCIGK